MTLSESLKDLSVRVNKLEDSAAATREQNRARLEARRQEVEETFDRQIRDFKAKGEGDEARIQQFLTETRAAVERQVETIRADYTERKAEREVAKAQRAADKAEETAIYCADVAEYAVIQAALARAEANARAGVS
jgi:hypothetical protein